MEERGRWVGATNPPPGRMPGGVKSYVYKVHIDPPGPGRLYYVSYGALRHLHTTFPGPPTLMEFQEQQWRNECSRSLDVGAGPPEMAAPTRVQRGATPEGKRPLEGSGGRAGKVGGSDKPPPWANARRGKVNRSSI